MERLIAFLNSTLGWLIISLLLSIQCASAELLDADTTIAVGEHSYSGDLIVPSGITLTIEAGAILRFDIGNELLIQGGGKLIVQGTELAPVVFTSDAMVANSWKGLRFEGARADGNEIVIDNAIIEYADKALYTNQNSVKVTVTNSIVRHNNYGVYVDAGTYSAPYHPYITFKDGALYDNAEYNYYTYRFYGSTITTIDATGNWWGAGEPQDIAVTIYDRIDASNTASVDFGNYLLSEEGPGAGTSYTGYITQDTTWSDGGGILAQPVHVTSGSTLTITEGTQLRAAQGAELVVESGGKLIVQGTELAPVVFTSDAMVANSWKGLRFEGARADGNEIVIDNAIIEYADKALYTNQNSVKVTVTNSIVRHNNYGVYVDAGTYSAPYHPYITFKDGALYDNAEYNYYTYRFYGSTITTIDATGNWWGAGEPQDIAVTIYDRIDASNTASVDFGNYLLSEEGPGAGTSYTGYITQDTTWSDGGGILAQPVHVTSGSTLTITEGTQLRAAQGAELVVESGGKLIVQGTELAPVVFTSDAMVANSWKGLRFEGARADGNEIVIDNAIIEYADKALYTNQNSVKVTVTNSIVRHNNYGVYVDAGTYSAPYHPYITFKDGALYDNAEYNYYTYRFYGSTITTIDATGNWWGAGEPQDIAVTIYDRIDASNTASVDFGNYLLSEEGPGAGTSYTGYITQDTTWSDGGGILAQPVHVTSGSTLTITEGTQLRAAQGAELVVESGGKLIVQGTELAPVVFTSDAMVANSWKGLRFEGARADGNEIVIDNAIIEYADKALYTNQNSVKVTVTNSIVRHNNYGVYVDAGTYSAPYHPYITFKDGALYDNAEYNYYTYRFYGSTITTIDATGNWWGTSDLAVIQTSIHDIKDASYTASINFAGLLSAENGEPLPGTHLMGKVVGESRWHFSDGMVLSDVSVQSGSTLIIESGSQLNFFDGSKLIVESGANLSVVGDSAAPVIFTSGNSTKSAGDWGGIEVQGNTNVQISNALIEYADKGISFKGIKAAGTITNNVIENNNVGIYVNGGWQSLANHPTPTVTNNIIQNNLGYNYYAELFGSASSRILNAKGNYWGTTDNTSIAQSIFDNSDSGSSPIVDSGFARDSEISTLIADAGPDVIGFGTIETLLKGSGSGHAAIANYHWEQYLGNQVALSNANSATSSFTVADVQNEELMSFLFTVTDTNDISASDKLDVVIKPYSEYNRAPTVSASQEILVSGGDAVSVTLSATDEDNDPLTYEWQQVSGNTVSLTTSNTDTLSFTAPSGNTNSVYNFKLTVTDNHYVVERFVLVAVKAAEANSGAYYYHNDHLGTPQVMTDSNASVVWQANYTPFGQADVVTEVVVNNIRFPGQYYDEESGLHYNYFRDYDPATGRYIQSDPIGLAGGINTYGYVNGDPIRYSDPYGLERTDVSIGGSIPFLGGFDIGLFTSDEDGKGCNPDLGIFVQFNKPHGGKEFTKGVGKLKLGPAIGYAPYEGRGRAIQADAQFNIGLGGLGVSATGLANSTLPTGGSIEGGVIFAFGADETVQFSLSVRDLGRLAAAIVNWNFDHQIFGAPENNNCGCEIR